MDSLHENENLDTLHVKNGRCYRNFLKKLQQRNGDQGFDKNYEKVKLQGNNGKK